MMDDPYLFGSGWRIIKISEEEKDRANESPDQEHVPTIVLHTKSIIISIGENEK